MSPHCGGAGVEDVCCVVKERELLPLVSSHCGGNGVEDVCCIVKESGKALQPVLMGSQTKHFYLT